MDKHAKDRRHDKAVDASDALSHGKPTGTKPPCRPIDRKAPRITKQIEQAQRGEGHKQE